MSAIRMLFSWLTEKGILAMNPAREVKTEKFSRREGKKPRLSILSKYRRSWIKLIRATKSAFVIALYWAR
jgi:site-specific recombinase XerC